MATLLLTHLAPELSSYRNKVWRFIAGHLQSENTQTKLWAYVAASRWIAAYPLPAKLVTTVFTALLRMDKVETKYLVNKALDVLIPALPERLPNDHHRYSAWLKWTKKILTEEGHAIPLAIHIYSALIRHAPLFYPARLQFIPGMINNLNKIGLSSARSLEHRKLAVHMAELIVAWDMQARFDAKQAALLEGKDGHEADNSALSAQPQAEPQPPAAAPAPAEAASSSAPVAVPAGGGTDSESPAKKLAVEPMQVDSVGATAPLVPAADAAVVPAPVALSVPPVMSAPPALPPVPNSWLQFDSTGSSPQLVESLLTFLFRLSLMTCDAAETRPLSKRIVKLIKEASELWKETGADVKWVNVEKVLQNVQPNHDMTLLYTTTFDLLTTALHHSTPLYIIATPTITFIDRILTSSIAAKVMTLALRDGIVDTLTLISSHYPMGSVVPSAELSKMYKTIRDMVVAALKNLDKVPSLFIHMSLLTVITKTYPHFVLTNLPFIVKALIKLTKDVLTRQQHLLAHHAAMLSHSRSVVPLTQEEKMKAVLTNDSLRKCLTGDHVVMTRSGWRSLAVIHREFEDAGAQGVSLPVIEVSTFNRTTSAMEWKRVTATQRFPAGQPGERVFRMQGEGMDVVATESHRMLTGRTHQPYKGKLQLMAGSFDIDTVGELAELTGFTTRNTIRTEFEHHWSRVVVRCGANRQPAYKFVIKGLEGVCDWWWQQDRQLGFLRFVGFWLGDGCLDVSRNARVIISQRKLEPLAWLLDLLDEVFPRWWYRNVDAADGAGISFNFLIRCLPLFEWLREMAVGPAGYMPLDPAQLRKYPHFDYDEEVAKAEAASSYHRPHPTTGTWREAEMVAAFSDGPVRRPCCVCGDASGVRVSCSGKHCHPGDAITRAHPACIGRTKEEEFHRRVGRKNEPWPWFCPHRECQKEATQWSAAHPSPAPDATGLQSQRSRAAKDEKDEAESENMESDVEMEAKSDAELEGEDVDEVMPQQQTTRSGRLSSAPARFAPVPSSVALPRSPTQSARRSSASSSSERSAVKRRRSSASTSLPPTCMGCNRAVDHCDCFECDGGEPDGIGIAPAASAVDVDAAREAEEQLEAARREDDYARRVWTAVTEDGTLVREVFDLRNGPMEEEAPVTAASPPMAAVAGAQIVASGVVWNGGVWDIDADGHWFYRKRWLGPNVASSFANLSQPQAVALLEGFNRADGTGAFVQFKADGKPTGQWRCTNSSMPLIHHLQLIGQLAGARVDLSRHSKQGKQNKGPGGRTLTQNVDHWELRLNFNQVYRAKDVVCCRLAKPKDVSTDIDGRGYYQYEDDGFVYDLTVADNSNFLTQRLSWKRIGSASDGVTTLGVRAHPVYVGNCLSICYEHVAALGEGRKAFLQSVTMLIERSSDMAMLSDFARQLDQWMTNDAVLTPKEKCQLLSKMTLREREKGYQDIIAQVLQTTLSLFRERRNDWLGRLQRVFMLGLRAEDTALRHQFEALLLSSLQPSLPDRLYYLFVTQDWEVMSDGYWISEAVQLLLSIVRKDRPLLPLKRLPLLPSFDYHWTDGGKKVDAIRSGTAGVRMNVRESEDSKKRSRARAFGETDADAKKDEAPREDEREKPKPSSSAPLVVPEQTRSGLLSAYSSWLHAYGNATMSDMLDTLTELAFYHIPIAHDLFIRLFSCGWTHLTAAQRTELGPAVCTLVAKSWQSRYDYEGWNRLLDKIHPVQTLLSAIHQAVPAIPIAPEVVRYAGKTFNAWHTAVEMLEERLNHINAASLESSLSTLSLNSGVSPAAAPSKSLVSTGDALCTLYRDLNEDDLWFGAWRRRCSNEYSLSALAHEQFGHWQRAQDGLYASMQRHHHEELTDLPSHKHEQVMWESEWVNAAKHLNQWEVLRDFSVHVGMVEVQLDAVWRLGEWGALKDLVQRYKDSDVVSGRLFHIYHALHERKASTEDISKLIDSTVQTSVLREWQSLPSVITLAHLPLLQRAQRITELMESTMALDDIGKAARQGISTLPNFKNFISTWRERLPNQWESVTVWSDILVWRSLMFNIIAQSYAAPAEGQGYRMNDSPWTIIKLAATARKQQLPSVCLTTLARLFTQSSPQLSTEDSFNKLREHIKTSLLSPTEMSAALNIISATNLDYFQSEQRVGQRALRFPSSASPPLVERRCRSLAVAAVCLLLRVV